MKILVYKLCIILFFISCSSNDKLRKACPIDCYSGPSNTLNEGICHSGTPICDVDFNVIFCENEVIPEKELCDGKDNDCDGSIDEHMYAIRKYEFWQGKYGLDVFPCNTLGECRNSILKCEDGKISCTYPDEAEEGEETKCDGKDNDCDGLIDEDVFWNLPVQFCYSGNPIDSAAYPPCRAGILKCFYGEIICLNEVTPSAELCDSIDNDCNGIIDDASQTTNQIYDIVFIIDNSGSMDDKIQAVINALFSYGNGFLGNENYKFAIIVMSSYFLPAPYIKLDLNFSDFSLLQSRLPYLVGGGGANEASLDSMWMVADRLDNPLGLNWREGSIGMFFMFTDELAQSYLSPLVTGQMVIDQCIANQVLPFIWAKSYSSFGYIATGANGLYFNLTNNSNQILSEINSIIITLCRD